MRLLSLALVASVIGSQSYASALKCTLRVNQNSATSQSELTSTETKLDGIIYRETRAQTGPDNPLSVAGYSCEAAAKKDMVNGEKQAGEIQVHLLKLEQRKRLATGRSVIAAKNNLEDAAAAVTVWPDDTISVLCSCKFE